MQGQSLLKPSKISGWLKPEGSFHEVEEWWHISFLYDLRDARDPLFADEESEHILQIGDESMVRDLAARKGLVKISRGEIDGYQMNTAQLSSLKDLIELADPEFEFRVLGRSGRELKTMSVGRIQKLRSAQNFFS